MEREIGCPYCGETISIWVDPGGGEDQSYVEDCQVCCKPIEIVVTGEDVEALRADE